MLFRTNAREQRERQGSPVERLEAMAPRDDNSHADQKAELRRLMYERIAQGNALAEAENNARRKWYGK